ncbi:hypothetical protein Hdeb2414_s0012g00387891 [Helianthus debilis subsp. tardiflorus]
METCFPLIELNAISKKHILFIWIQHNEIIQPKYTILYLQPYSHKSTFVIFFPTKPFHFLAKLWRRRSINEDSVTVYTYSVLSNCDHRLRYG